MRAIQRFEVSLKAFIVRDGRALFVREADSGYWELPGGRIDVGEEWEPHLTILAREMREELGPGVSVELGAEAVTWTRQRPTDGAFLFLLARVGRIAADVELAAAGLAVTRGARVVLDRGGESVDEFGLDAELDDQGQEMGWHGVQSDCSQRGNHSESHGT